MCLLCSLAFAGAAAGQAATEPQTELSLPVGAERILTVPNLRGFAHSALNPGCGTLSVRPFGEDRLVVSGGTAGEAKLLLFTEGAPPRALRVRVRRAGLETTACGLCRMLPSGYGADVRQSGAEVFVAGTMTSIEEALAAGRAKAVHPQIRIVARLREGEVREALLEINHALWREGLLRHRAVLREGRVALAGPPLTPEAQGGADAVMGTLRDRLEAALAVTEAPDETLPAAIKDPCSMGR